MVLSNTRALVLFSGGQDSATCLAWALDRFAEVETIGFSYGQRHAVELTCRKAVVDGLLAAVPAWRQRLGADHSIDLSSLGDLSQTALTREAQIEFESTGLPNTFVPGRNLLFFTYAGALAYRRDIRHLVGGMCETDYSGYPDCRDDTLKALQVTLGLGMDRSFVVQTPLMWLAGLSRRPKAVLQLPMPSSRSRMASCRLRQPALSNPTRRTGLKGPKA